MKLAFCISVVGSAMSFSFRQGMQHAAHAAPAPGCSWEPLAAVSNWDLPLLALLLSLPWSLTAGSCFCDILSVVESLRAGHEWRNCIPWQGWQMEKVTPWTACISVCFCNLSSTGLKGVGIEWPSAEKGDGPWIAVVWAQGHPPISAKDHWKLSWILSKTQSVRVELRLNCRVWRLIK